MSDWFSEQVLAWAKQHGRKDLPWQVDRTPYRVWVSEIMLQQTQVTTVVPYFTQFMVRFPDVRALANASLDDVLEIWTGLGYYRRARYLHRAARQITQEFDGDLPNTLDQLMTLPGIGQSTAGAILACGFDQRGVILDGNVKRVLSRFHAIGGDPSRSAVVKQLWELADSHTPTAEHADYVQAIMDLGATCCTRSDPICMHCPIHSQCRAYQQNRVADFPERKRRTAPRNESLQLLIVMDAKNRCLLQRQPEDGLWGSLWLPPRLETKESTIEALQRLGLKYAVVESTRNCPLFIHTLSHIRFNVKAKVICLSQEGREEPDRNDLIWYDDGTSTIGLATLTTKLLEMVRD